MIYRCTALFSILLLVVACGGSGGDSTGEPNTQPTQNNPPVVNGDGTVGQPPDPTGSEVPTSGEGSSTSDPSTIPGETGSENTSTGESGSDTGDVENDTSSSSGMTTEELTDVTSLDNADIEVIFGRGGQVPGLNNAEFVSISGLSVAENGDTCLSATYQQENERLHGVWCGLPLSPVQVLKSGDNIDNLPANILFEQAGNLATTRNGNILIVAKLTGASNSTAMLVWNGQTVESILRTGELAPGWPEATAIGSIETVSISDAGAVMHGTVGPFLTPAVWQWNGSKFSLISAFAGITVLPVDQNGCDISVSFPSLPAIGPKINNNGIIAFNANLNQGSQTVDNSLCRGTAIIQYDGDSFVTIVKSRDIVPGTETAIFNSVVLNELFDSGSMSVTAVLTDDNTSGIQTGRYSNWVFHPDGSADLISIVEETVPPNYIDKLSLIGHTPIVIAASAEHAVQIGKTETGTIVLTGSPHVGMPYSDIGAVGATSMSFVASTNASAPDGYPPTAFISSFSRPSIDRAGRIYYRARIEQAGSDSVADSFYLAQQEAAPQRLFASGDEVFYGGESRQIQSINYDDAVLLSFVVNNAAGIAISQNKHAVVPVSLAGYSNALLHVTVR